MNEIQREELRKLAEAMPDLDWDSQFEDHEQTGFCCVYAKPFELDGEKHDGPTFVERCHPDQAKFIAEAKEKILTLLDESEACNHWRLLALQFDRQRMKAMGYLKSIVSGVAVTPKELESFVNSAPEQGYELDQHMARLVAENEELRKDSKRYRWIAGQADLESYGNWEYSLPMVCAWDIKQGPQLNEQFENFDQAIDAAMAKDGEQ